MGMQMELKLRPKGIIAQLKADRKYLVIEQERNRRNAERWMNNAHTRTEAYRTYAVMKKRSRVMRYLHLLHNYLRDVPYNQVESRPKGFKSDSHWGDKGLNVPLTEMFFTHYGLGTVQSFCDWAGWDSFFPPRSRQLQINALGLDMMLHTIQYELF